VHNIDTGSITEPLRLGGESAMIPCTVSFDGAMTNRSGDLFRVLSAARLGIKFLDSNKRFKEQEESSPERCGSAYILYPFNCKNTAKRQDKAHIRQHSPERAVETRLHFFYYMLGPCGG
jgi:hypothetical protein